jgi:hypothetical protein
VARLVFFCAQTHPICERALSWLIRVHTTATKPHSSGRRLNCTPRRPLRSQKILKNSSCVGHVIRSFYDNILFGLDAVAKVSSTAAVGRTFGTGPKAPLLFGLRAAAGRYNAFKVYDSLISDIMTLNGKRESNSITKSGLENNIKSH